MTIFPPHLRKPTQDQVQEGEHADDERDDRRASHRRLERPVDIHGVVWRDLGECAEDDSADEPRERAEDERRGEAGSQEDRDHPQHAEHRRPCRWFETILWRGHNGARAGNRGGMSGGAGFDVRGWSQGPKLRIAVFLRVVFVRERLVATRISDWKPGDHGFRRNREGWLSYEGLLRHESKE